jgi:pimeloyl-ACP methyl ester carboxylesterase
MIAGRPCGILLGVALEQQIRAAERRLFDRAGLEVGEPAPRAVYARLFGQGMSPAAAAAAPAEMLDVLRFAARRPGNARTTAALMHALNSFRQPRPEIGLTGAELRSLSVPTLFCWGRDDRFLPAASGEPAAALIPSADFRAVPGGHGPWFEDPPGCAELAIRHLTASGFPPAAPAPPQARS